MLLRTFHPRVTEYDLCYFCFSKYLATEASLWGRWPQPWLREKKLMVGNTMNLIPLLTFLELLGYLWTPMKGAWQRGALQRIPCLSFALFFLLFGWLSKLVQPCLLLFLLCLSLGILFAVPTIALFPLFNIRFRLLLPFCSAQVYRILEFMDGSLIDKQWRVNPYLQRVSAEAGVPRVKKTLFRFLAVLLRRRIRIREQWHLKSPHFVCTSACMSFFKAW